MSAQADSARTDADAAAGMLADLFGGVVRDPYPLYEGLRETGDGVHWSELLHGWVVTRYTDVRLLGSDHGTFSSDTFFDGPPGLHDPADAEHRRFVEINSREFMFSDPPRHTRLRSIFRHAFTPAAIAAWRPLVERTTAELLGRFGPGQEIEFMSALAADVPVAIIAALLGVPVDDRWKFREWSFALASTFDPLVQGERRDACIRKSLQLLDYLHDVLRARREKPEDDLVSLLARTTTADGGLLDDTELLAQIGLLLVAGNETTANLLGNGITLLLRNPEVAERWRGDPSVAPRAIEEILRCDPPLHMTMRKITQQVELGGRTLEPGTHVFPVIPAANRDPRQFDEPGKFDIDRADNRHLSFFHGIHFCVGAPLARLEGEVVFTALLTHFPGMTEGAEPPTRRTTNAVSRGWESRPVRL
jgi:cytochrome P450